MGVSDAMGITPLQATRQYGITKPISTAGPTEADLQRTKELEKVRPFLLLIPLPPFLYLLVYIICYLGF